MRLKQNMAQNIAQIMVQNTTLKLSLTLAFLVSVPLLLSTLYANG